MVQKNVLFNIESVCQRFDLNILMSWYVASDLAGRFYNWRSILHFKILREGTQEKFCPLFY